MIRRLYILPLTVAALSAADATAHHAPALYDNDKLMSIDGEVVSLAFRFPHSELLLRNNDGTTWTVSLAPPDVSVRQGKKDALLAIQPGERVTVWGWPHRLKGNEIRSHKLVFADGGIIDGAFNSLYEPKQQKQLKRLLADQDKMNRLNDGDTSFGSLDEKLNTWFVANDPLTRLAVEINFNRAAFIGITDNDFVVYPGIKEHLQCLPNAFATETYSASEPEAGALTYIKKHNEWLARYLEGQLNICD